jgi:hypothetical protein
VISNLVLSDSDFDSSYGSVDSADNGGSDFDGLS